MPVPTEIARDPSGPAQTERRKDERLPREQRLLRRAEFVRVQQQGRRVHTGHFILLMLGAKAPPARAGQPPHVAWPVVTGTRLGVTVGRKVGGAVQRNRVKRLVREVFRRNRGLFPKNCDVVLVARPGSDRLDYQAVLDELVRAQAAIERVRRQWSAEQEQQSEP